MAKSVKAGEKETKTSTCPCKVVSLLGVLVLILSLIIKDWADFGPWFKRPVALQDRMKSLEDTLVHRRKLVDDEKTEMKALSESLKSIYESLESESKFYWDVQKDLQDVKNKSSTITSIPFSRKGLTDMQLDYIADTDGTPAQGGARSKLTVRFSEEAIGCKVNFVLSINGQSRMYVVDVKKDVPVEPFISTAAPKARVGMEIEHVENCEKRDADEMVLRALADAKSIRDIELRREYAISTLMRVQNLEPNILPRALRIPERKDFDHDELLKQLQDNGPRLMKMNLDAVASDKFERTLKKIVGQADLKAKLRDLRESLTRRRERLTMGAPVVGNSNIHMIFSGHPGVGKTIIARMMSTLLHELGYLGKAGVMREVKRANLVAGYVGQTAKKTKDEVEKAKGGILFIDEAYQLASESGSNDFGREALDQLMGDMEPGDPVMVFALYPEEKDKFLAQNAGLERRLLHFDFPDLKPRDIVEIFKRKMEDNGFEFGDDCNLNEIATLVEKKTTEKWRATRNGQLSEDLEQKTFKAQMRRITAASTAAEQRTIILADITAAVDEIKSA